MSQRMTAEALRAFYRNDGQLGDLDGPSAPRWHRRDLEGPIHKGIGELFDRLGIYAHHSPNELDMAGNDAKRAVSKAKAMGMRPGWPDWEFPHNGKIYFLEVKAESPVTSVQAEVHAQLRARGCEVRVVRSVTEAHEVLQQWGIV